MPVVCRRGLWGGWSVVWVDDDGGAGGRRGDWIEEQVQAPAATRGQPPPHHDVFVLLVVSGWRWDACVWCGRVPSMPWRKKKSHSGAARRESLRGGPAFLFPSPLHTAHKTPLARGGQGQEDADKTTTTARALLGSPPSFLVHDSRFTPQSARLPMISITYALGHTVSTPTTTMPRPRQAPYSTSAASSLLPGSDGVVSAVGGEDHGPPTPHPHQSSTRHPHFPFLSPTPHTHTHTHGPHFLFCRCGAALASTGSGRRSGAKMCLA